MLSPRHFRRRLRHIGMAAAAFVFLLQTFAAASMPMMSVSVDGVVVICTSSGMKTVSLSSLGLTSDSDQDSPLTGPPCGKCALCLLAHNLAMASPMAVVPAIDLVTHARPSPPNDRWVVNGRGPIQQARAPPSRI